MSSPHRGKTLVEDYGPFYGRGPDWPAYPKDLNPLYPLYTSTSVVCASCGHPTGGLRYDPDTELFVHRTKVDCVQRFASLR